MSIIGIPSTRISDQFSRLVLLRQVQGDQVDLLRLENQLSTGQRFQLPSEDPVAAMRVMSLQQLLARKTQIQSNLTTNQSFLSATDTAMSQVSGMIADVRAAALGVIGTTATDEQRRAAAQQVQQALEQLVNTAEPELPRPLSVRRLGNRDAALHAPRRQSRPLRRQPEPAVQLRQPRSPLRHELAGK